MKTIYVAAASCDWQRARACMLTIESAGLRNAHGWTVHVQLMVASGVRESDIEDDAGARFAREDLAAVERSDALVLLAPSAGGRMCWYELGYADALGIPCIVAHDVEERRNQSIVTRLHRRVIDAEIVGALGEIGRSR